MPSNMVLSLPSSASNMVQYRRHECQISVMLWHVHNFIYKLVIHMHWTREPLVRENFYNTIEGLYTAIPIFPNVLHSTHNTNPQSKLFCRHWTYMEYWEIRVQTQFYKLYLRICRRKVYVKEYMLNVLPTADYDILQHWQFYDIVKYSCGEKKKQHKDLFSFFFSL